MHPSLLILFAIFCAVIWVLFLALKKERPGAGQRDHCHAPLVDSPHPVERDYSHAPARATGSAFAAGVLGLAAANGLEDDYLCPRTGVLADDEVGSSGSMFDDSNGSSGSMFDDDDFSRTGIGFDDCINPATGLPMIGGIGGVDVAGNPYGTSGDDFSTFDDSFSSCTDISSMDDSFSSSTDDHFSSGIDSSSSFMDDSFSSMDDSCSGWNNDW